MGSGRRPPPVLFCSSALCPHTTRSRNCDALFFRSSGSAIDPESGPQRCLLHSASGPGSQPPNPACTRLTAQLTTWPRAGDGKRERGLDGVVGRGLDDGAVAPAASRPGVVPSCRASAGGTITRSATQETEQDGE